MQLLPSLRQPRWRKYATRLPGQHSPTPESNTLSGWGAAVGKGVCYSYDNLSLLVWWLVIVSLTTPTNPLVSLSFFLHPQSLSAPAPSLCPRWLPDEEELMPEFIVELRLLPASLGSSAQLWGGGTCCFKGTAIHTAPPLLSSPLHRCQHFLSMSSRSAYLALVCVSIEGAISLKSTWSLPLLTARQSLGTKCPQMLGYYIINTQSRLALDDLI